MPLIFRLVKGAPVTFLEGDDNLRYLEGLAISSSTNFSNWTGSALSQFAGTASLALTASYALNAGTTIDTGSLVTTSSFNSFTASYNTGSFTGSFTGELIGTASFAISASWAPSSILSTSFISTGSVSASVDITTSSFFQVQSGSSNLLIVRNPPLAYSWTGIEWGTSANGLSLTAGSGPLRIGTLSGNGILFTTNITDRWILDGTGIFYPGGNNLYDIGTSTNRVRNIWAAGLDVSGSGRFTNGLTVSGSGNIFTVASSSANLLTVSSSGVLVVASSASLALGRSVQITPSTDGGSISTFSLLLEGASGLRLRTTSNNSINFNTNNLDRWYIEGAGSLTTATDNIHDIGRSGSNRPRNIYAAGTGSVFAALDITFGSTNALKTFPSTGNTFLGSTPTDGGFKLDVNGTARIQDTLTLSNNKYLQFIYSVGSNGFAIKQDTSNRLVIDNGNYGYNVLSIKDTSAALSSTGLVGIFTQNPTATLDVSGSGRFTDGLTVTGSITTTSGSITLATGSITITSGSITMPNRPAFRVIGTSSTNITATTTLSGSAASVDYNIGNYYNNTTGVFTAPIAGLYSVYMNLRCGSINAQQQAILYKNDTTSSLMWEALSNTSATHFGVSGILNLNVNDTLKVVVAVGSINFDANDNWGAAYIG